MAMCDVCARPDADEAVGGPEFLEAVKQGYDPFAMGLAGPTLEQIASMAEITGDDPYLTWRARVESSDLSVWQVCAACMPALGPFLDRKASRPSLQRVTPGPTECSKCGEHNPASQWHCSHCGHVQWGLITFSLLLGGGFLFWALTVSSWFGRGVLIALAVLFVWIGASSIREAARDRRG